MTVILRFIPFIFTVACIIQFFSCVTIQYQRDIEDYRDKITELEATLSLDPDDAMALRELGVIYFETGLYLEARDYLAKAFTNNADDAKTMLYLGMALEFRGETQAAQEIQQNYVRVSRLSPYRKLMQSRYHRLSRELVRSEMRSLLQREAELSEDRLMPRTLAVFPLDYIGTENDFRTLGRGISQMLITDLGKVRELTVLERIRLNTLVQELELSQTQLIDKQTAPRLGKLLGAGRIVAGSFDVHDKSQLDVDLLSWDMINQSYPEAVTQSGALQSLFTLEKDLAFGIITEMGIELTPEERDDIQRIPTQNLQSFIAYCKGLERDDASDFPAAVDFFKQAVQLDPNFQQAGNALESAESMADIGDSPEDIKTELARIQGKQKVPEAESIDLLSNRLQNLNNGLGANFIPGQDNRKPAEEFTGSTVAEDLSAPPPPPSN